MSGPGADQLDGPGCQQQSGTMSGTGADRSGCGHAVRLAERRSPVGPASRRPAGRLGDGGGDGPPAGPPRARGVGRPRPARSSPSSRADATTARGHVAAVTGLEAPAEGAGARRRPPGVDRRQPGDAAAHARARRRAAGRAPDAVGPGLLGRQPGDRSRGRGAAGPAVRKGAGAVRHRARRPSPRLLLVAPNIVAVERELGVDPADFRLWVCLHEETHRVQFTAVPWLRDHVLGETQGLAADLLPDASVPRPAARGSGPGACPRCVRGEGGSLAEVLLTPAQRERLARLTAVMSLLEGHADVVMDDVGPEVIPQRRADPRALPARGAGRGGVDRLLRRLLGLEAKMRQYRDGAGSSGRPSTRSACPASTRSGARRRPCPCRPRSTTPRPGWAGSTP